MASRGVHACDADLFTRHRDAATPRRSTARASTARATTTGATRSGRADADEGARDAGWVKDRFIDGEIHRTRAIHRRREMTRARRSASTGGIPETAMDETGEGTSGRGAMDAMGAASTKDEAGDGKGSTARRRRAGGVVTRKRSSLSDGADEDEDGEAKNQRFECNVCFDTASEPAVTPCGHLYCWKCIRKWMDAGNDACPVCKGAIASDTVIALYGFGDKSAGRAKSRTGGSDDDLESSKSLATVLGLRGIDTATVQANQLLLARILLTIGTLFIVCLLII